MNLVKTNSRQTYKFEFGNVIVDNKFMCIVLDGFNTIYISGTVSNTDSLPDLSSIIGKIIKFKQDRKLGYLYISLFFNKDWKFRWYSNTSGNIQYGTQKDVTGQD